MTKIIGISLVKNEDRFVKKSLENVIDFCDKIILLDNNSNDKTFEILQNIRDKYPEKIELHLLDDALKSHYFIEKYANTDTWVFGVDGDEIYEKRGLQKFKTEIISGKYQKFFQVFGHALHVVSLNKIAGTATGYMAPPSKSITKLYNFNAIFEWREHAERLHGNDIKFKPGYSRKSIVRLSDQYSWENSPFGCIHLCFLNRSSRDTKKKTRFNPTENAKWYFPLINAFRNILRGDFSFDSSYKLRKYKRGPLTTVWSKEFF